MKPVVIPFRATITLAGTRPLFTGEELNHILDILEHDQEFNPTHWSLDDRRADLYSRSEILGFLTDRGERALPQTAIFLWRKQPPRYEATLDLSRQPRVGIEFNPKFSMAERGHMFGLADALAERFHPDWGVAHLWYRLRPKARLGEPWKNDDERDAELLYRTALLAPVDYFDEGPRGLGMRTYIGPHFAEQLGRGRIESLPLIVTKLSWGGYRVDLVPQPWNADVQTLLPAWRQAMAQLRDARIFAEPRIAGNLLDGYTKGERSIIGGVVG